LKGLTVDVGVLMSGSNLGDPKHFESSATLMRSLVDFGEARIVLDTENLILTQYDNKLGGKEDSHGKRLVQQMINSGKVEYVKRAVIDRGTKTGLKECHFDLGDEDYKLYVRTAAASDQKRLTSHDPDYSARVCKVLNSRLKVLVWSASKSVEYLTG
jgi:hypothetical protein